MSCSTLKCEQDKSYKYYMLYYIVQNLSDGFALHVWCTKVSVQLNMGKG